MAADFGKVVMHREEMIINFLHKGSLVEIKGQLDTA